MIKFSEFIEKISFFQDHKSEKFIQCICMRINNISGIDTRKLIKNKNNFKIFRKSLIELYLSSNLNKSKMDEEFELDNEHLIQKSQRLVILHDELIDFSNSYIKDEARYAYFLNIGIAKDSTKNLKRWYKTKTIRHERQVSSYFHKLVGNIGSEMQEIVPATVLESRKKQIQAQEKYIDSTYLMRTDADGFIIKIPFRSVCKTQEKISSKIYVKLKGVEVYAKQLGLTGYFLTLTLPAKYHPKPKNGNSSWDGSTPDEAHNHLQHLWRNIQKIMNKKGGKLIGIRVEEPHLDGCPHWHLLIFIDNKRIGDLRFYLNLNFPGNNSYKIIEIDETKASAASYVTKYINTFFSSSETTEAAQASHKNSKSQSYSAHSATWVGRRIEFFDVKGSSTSWDLLRTISNQDSLTGLLTNDGKDLMNAACTNNYGEFLFILSRMNEDPKNKRVKIIYNTSLNNVKSIAGIEIDMKKILLHDKQWVIGRLISKS